MSSIIVFNKPFQVLSQFSDRDATVPETRKTLADFLSAPNFRVAGRLDYDSEGLVVLTDDGQLQQRIANPKHKLWKTYWVQVEGEIDDHALQQLRTGVNLKDGPTRPVEAKRLSPPDLWPRNPPVRYRAAIPDCWIELKLQEGRNRQVRRMTAAVGFPTLRLVRVAVGDWALDGLEPGNHRIIALPEMSAPDKDTGSRHSKRPGSGRETNRSKHRAQGSRKNSSEQPRQNNSNRKDSFPARGSQQRHKRTYRPK